MPGWRTGRHTWTNEDRCWGWYRVPGAAGCYQRGRGTETGGELAETWTTWTRGQDVTEFV